MDKKQELSLKLGEVFGSLEQVLMEIRQPNNTVELTEAYKKMKELGLWLTLALSIEQPVTSSEKQRDVKFGKGKNKQPIANTK